MPGKKTTVLCTILFMTAKPTVVFFLSCRHRPVSKLQVFRPFGGVFRLFLRMTKKACPSDRKKRAAFLRPATVLSAPRREYMWTFSGPYCCLGRQLSATLCATASQYLAAVRGGHALAETVNLFPLPNFGLKSHLHSVQYLFLAYLQGNIAICPTHAQRSIFGEKSFARQISEENPIVSQLVIIAAMPPFCQAQIRTSEPVFILFLQYIIIFLFVSSCSIPQLVPFGRVCFPPCLNSRFCSAQPHCVRFHTHRRLHFVLII